MNLQELPLGFHEKVVFSLRSLYSRYGYSQYKMSKFEEYDLYARNKDFLISDRVITFLDTNGKLMALKPDVTLSIVKNSKDDTGTVQKLYYNENVYRAGSGSQAFKEITQVGLECLGRVDDYCICEVLLLAAESLKAICPEGVLDVSHLGLLAAVMNAIGVPAEGKDALLMCIGEKNLHEMTAVCNYHGVSEDGIQLLKQVLSTSGSPDTVLPKLCSLLEGVIPSEPLEQLARVTEALADSDAGQMIRIDFSAVDDMHYYNGVVFKGYVPGLPSSVLTGGQYDKLMRKMGRKSGAIGFAVYMDTLERLDTLRRNYDVDTVLLYDESCSLSQIRKQVAHLTEAGASVLVQRSIPENIRSRSLLKLRGEEVEVLENNA